MCSMFSQIDSATYAYQTRSVRLGGHATSIRLEAAFWAVLEEIAVTQAMSLGRFLTKLHDEVLEFRGEAQNFTSLLRCSCLTWLSKIRSAEAGRNPFEAVAPPAFGGSLTGFAREHASLTDRNPTWQAAGAK